MPKKSLVHYELYCPSGKSRRRLRAVLMFEENLSRVTSSDERGTHEMRSGKLEQPGRAPRNCSSSVTAYMTPGGTSGHTVVALGNSQSTQRHCTAETETCDGIQTLPAVYAHRGFFCSRCEAARRCCAGTGRAKRFERPKGTVATGYWPGTTGSLPECSFWLSNCGKPKTQRRAQLRVLFNHSVHVTVFHLELLNRLLERCDAFRFMHAHPHSRLVLTPTIDSFR
ncbi:hypothetical protein CSUI_000876 [Cystoisospora suis]|uniref:Uncharacterized protein n=1 Tax=Cystoisospora suis TaxID=483139 RepID=A0A2C6LEF4_9APIC|nr:hypothetical protein CSUI_000876 [Cystoisospora suis]